MYAIIETGGKQVRVAEGDVIDVELTDVSDQNTVNFDNVLFLNDGNAIRIGTPHVSGCSVQAEFVGEVKGPKVVNFKYKKRKSCHRKVGHRQRYTRVKITKIVSQEGK